MKLKDIIKEDLFCFFKMENEDFLYSRDEKLFKYNKYGEGERQYLSFIIENLDKEVIIQKTAMEMYEEMGF